VNQGVEWRIWKAIWEGSSSEGLGVKEWMRRHQEEDEELVQDVDTGVLGIESWTLA
jgi:hypothetical protein